MKLSFYGAAGTVTGSKHLIETAEGEKILLDCGMFQGLGSRTAELNAEFGFDAADIDVLLLTHAHIDHSGLIPKLVKEGFTGSIYCTEATMELTEILLYDSASIQEHEADHARRRNKSTKDIEPLYSTEDVDAAMKLFKAIPYDQPIELTANVQAIYTNAGHLIGSACIHLTIKENDVVKTIAFSGDVGRYRSVLLLPPNPFPQADHIILESTYGNSMHEHGTSAVDPLLKWINKTCIDKQGKLIIPAFSVGRTQEVLYALNQLELEKRLPELSYFVDSPLSMKATSVIKKHMNEFNEKLQKVLAVDDDPFAFEGLKYIENVDDSQRLAEYDKPCVIISASGTADAGRVKHHLFSTIAHQQHTVLFVGYCQQQSLGGQLLGGNKTVEIFGDECEVGAEVNSLTAMSAHGDSDDLLQFMSCQDASKVSNVFLVHGEPSVQEEFAGRLNRKGFEKVIIPALRSEYEL